MQRRSLLFSGRRQVRIARRDFSSRCHDRLITVTYFLDGPVQAVVHPLQPGKRLSDLVAPRDIDVRREVTCGNVADEPDVLA
ncbi:hypothetical protein B7H01_04070 [Pandoraea apista]|nr:hypothetical protein [Pandoraea apista]OXS96828.1 hypothetical protein B7H01_04070 [Pandoraea apista]